MVKKWCWRVPTHPLLLISDDLVTGSSGEVGNSPVHLKIESGFVKVSDDTPNVSALSFEVPPQFYHLYIKHYKQISTNMEN